MGLYQPGSSFSVGFYGFSWIENHGTPLSALCRWSPANFPPERQASFTLPNELVLHREPSNQFRDANDDQWWPSISFDGQGWFWWSIPMASNDFVAHINPNRGTNPTQRSIPLGQAAVNDLHRWLLWCFWWVVGSSSGSSSGSKPATGGTPHLQTRPHIGNHPFWKSMIFDVSQTRWTWLIRRSQLIWWSNFCQRRYEPDHLETGEHPEMNKLILYGGVCTYLSVGILGTQIPQQLWFMIFCPTLSCRGTYSFLKVFVVIFDYNRAQQQSQQQQH